MFTGLIRHTGTLAARSQNSQGIRLSIQAPPQLLGDTQHGASIAVMGVCLTVTAAGRGSFETGLTEETLSKTTLGSLPIGSPLNLEPALKLGAPLDGHQVSGHVDAVGRLAARAKHQGLWRFSHPPQLSPMIAPKGSIAIDGISLTVVEASADSFTVALIPETIEATTLSSLKVGSPVNIEVDPIGRHVARFLAAAKAESMLTGFAKEGWDYTSF